HGEWRREFRLFDPPTNRGVRAPSPNGGPAGRLLPGPCASLELERPVMPFRLYVHSCCTITPVATVAPTCDQCGTHGEFYRWELHRPEWNAVYSRWSGLRPNGPHEKRADALLQPLRQSCSRCQGRTVIGDEAGWRRCPLCEGAGGIWTATDEAIR